MVSIEKEEATESAPEIIVKKKDEDTESAPENIAAMELLQIILLCAVVLLAPTVQCRPSSTEGLRRERRAVLRSKLETKLIFVKSVAKESKYHLENLRTSEEVHIATLLFLSPFVII